MRKFCLFVALIVLVVVGVGNEAYGQLGLGIKVPSTTVFIANQVDGSTIFEMGASLSALSNSVIALSADGKLYFADVHAGLLLEPFIGAGINITFLTNTIFFSPFLLAGADTAIPNTPLTAFMELGLGLTFSTFGIGLVPGGQLGVRLDF